MKHFFSLSLLLFIVTSSVSYSSDAYITYDDVYKRDGILFKKFTSEPFSGDIKKFPNEDNTKFFATDRYENGKLVYDEFFNDDGSLHFKRNYKNGILKDGDYKYYYSDGSIAQSYTIKNGRLKGERIWFRKNGSPYIIFEIDERQIASQKEFDEDGILQFTKNGRFNDGFLYHPNEHFHQTLVWDNANYEFISYHPNGNYFIKYHKKGKVYDGYYDNYYWDNGILSFRTFLKKGKKFKPIFHPTLIFKKFPLCSFKTSKGNICKYLEKSEKDNYSFHSFLEKENIQKTKEYFSHFKTDDWNYFFNVSMDEEDNILLHFTDDGISGTYFVTKTYGITYSEEKENWVINSETINYVDGSKEDKKIEGKVTKFDPPIPFIECVEFNQNGLCLE